MRTLIIIGIGLVLLGLCLGAQVFIGVWLVAAAVNMYIGVARAGYSFVEELPIFLLIFAVPAVVAVFVRYRF